VTVSDILDSDHLPVSFHVLDHVKTKNLPEPIRKIHELGTISKPYLLLNIT
jgi:hypothetical protein